MQVFGKKIDRLIIVSFVLHILLIGAAMVTVSSRPAVLPPEDAVPVDIVTASEMTKIMQGAKNGQKENPKPKVDKVAEAKPVDDDAIGKVEDKKPPIKTTIAPDSPPKPVEKPEEKKPEPPKPVVKNEPKPEPPKPEKKPEPKKDELGDLMKDAAKQPAPKPEKKPEPKQEAAKAPPPKPQPKQEKTLDDYLKTALIDKRDPTRNSITGAEVNQKSALGTSKGNAVDNSATWGAIFERLVGRCWSKPYGNASKYQPFGVIVRLTRDGNLQEPAKLESPSSDPAYRAYQESGLRAVQQCQPYSLPPTMYEGLNGWNFFVSVMQDKD